MADREIRKGIKTFFLNVDSTMALDESQLQTFFLGGYEVYLLAENRLIPIEHQIDCLCGLFEELIVFFNIDDQLKGTTWEELILQITGTHGSKVRLGVFHHETDPVKRKALEELYLLDLQIQAGCIFVEQKRLPDMATIQRTLVANEANGRRKAIRMSCHGRLNFSISEHRHEARILDISISHFMCIFKKDGPQIGVSNRVRDIQMMVGGPVFNVDAYLLMKRVNSENSDEMIYVFGFAKTNSTELGLDKNTRTLLIKLIHRYCTDNIHELIRVTYQKRRRLNTLSGSQSLEDLLSGPEIATLGGSAASEKVSSQSFN